MATTSLRSTALLLAATAVLSACGSHSRQRDSVRGCVPACLPPAFAKPGALAKGDYTTRNFFAGNLTVTVDEGWEAREDSTGEFRVAPAHGGGNAVLFWEDVYPVSGGRRVRNVPPTADGLIHWLRKNRNLRVSKPVSSTIGELPAKVVTLAISSRATSDDPSCPVRICVNPLGFPDWDEPYGMGGTDARRLSVADVEYGGRTHLFAVLVESADPAALSAFAPAADRLIASVRVPVDSA